MAKVITCCLNQFIRPSQHINIEGVGDCTKCTTDEDNKNCKYYYPIHVTIDDGE